MVDLICPFLTDSKTERTDLSHPIHSDNCIIQPDNTCKKEPPAYTSRDYSAVMYLNQDFQGGEFFFTHQNMSMQVRQRWLQQTREFNEFFFKFKAFFLFL